MCMVSNPEGIEAVVTNPVKKGQENWQVSQFVPYKIIRYRTEKDWSYKMLDCQNSWRELKTISANKSHASNQWNFTTNIFLR